MLRSGVGGGALSEGHLLGRAVGDENRKLPDQGPNFRVSQIRLWLWAKQLQIAFCLTSTMVLTTQ